MPLTALTTLTTLKPLTPLFTIKSFLSSLLLAACRNRPKEGELITKKEVLQKLLLLKDLSQEKWRRPTLPLLKQYHRRARA